MTGHRSAASPHLPTHGASGQGAFCGLESSNTLLFTVYTSAPLYGACTQSVKRPVDEVCLARAVSVSERQSEGTSGDADWVPARRINHPG